MDLDIVAEIYDLLERVRAVYAQLIEPLFGYSQPDKRYEWEYAQYAALAHVVVDYHAEMETALKSLLEKKANETASIHP